MLTFSYLCATNAFNQMNFDIVEVEELSGRCAHIYTVRVEGDDNTLLEQFFDSNADHEEELVDIVQRLKVMGNRTGCRRHFFTEGEGVLGDGVMAMKSGKMRLYGIYFNNAVVLFGSGGWKETRTYQEDPKLNKAAMQVREIAKIINKAINNREIIIEPDGIINDDNFIQI